MTKSNQPDGERRSTLHQAVVHADVAEVRRLLDLGAEVRLADRHGFTPLHFAAQEQRAELVPVLISAGADVDARDAWGNTPLFRAVFNARGHGETVVALLAAGADPDVQNASGRSPRDLAASIANYDVARFLPAEGS